MAKKSIGISSELFGGSGFTHVTEALTERTATLASLGKQFQTKPVKLALQDRRKEKERVKERDRKDRDRNDKVPRTLQFHRQITHRLEHFFLHGLCNGEHFFGFWVLVAQPSWPLVFSMRLQVKSTKTRSGTTKSGRKADDDSEDDIEKEKARWQ